jgi:hypothetical protein
MFNRHTADSALDRPCGVYRTRMDETAMLQGPMLDGTMG